MTLKWAAAVSRGIWQNLPRKTVVPTEEVVTFVNKLSVVAPCSEIIALICFTWQQRG